jgi:lipopolysaccharide/colanic/teichoic acid biosynthesis glycosyltransferase
MPRLYTSIGKRSGDLILATLALLASAPLLLAIAAVVRLDVGRPVLFRQRRPGLNGLPFTLLKFRTMRDARGPRPLLMQYLDRYTSDQARRHKVRPGITGLAQVGGRNALTWQQKFALDVEYVDNCSWRLDVAILALTAREVLRRRNVNQPGHATAQEFMGPPAT